MQVRASLLTLGVISVLTFGAGFAAADPPFRVARLSVAEGAVSYLPGDSDEWRPAELNYPMTSGDTVWSDRGSRAELHIGSTAIRLGAETSAGFLNLDDRTVQIRLTQGILQVHVRRLDTDQVLEVDTPNGAVSLLRPGNYRIDAFPENSGSVVAVREGEAEATGGGTAFPIRRGETARIYGGVDQLQYDLVATVPPDGWDQWCADRDRYEDQAAEEVRPYVSREMAGYEDLAGNGVWTESPDYGPVWTPRSMPPGWAPYRYGHWAYIAPWGWTWIDDAPWGFAPFHYGRWVIVLGNWCWVPGPVVSRPVYAPALVVFVGGGNVGWFPLGPREVYRPGYRVSEIYVRNVNVTNIRNITNVTTITNVRYVNRDHGTTAVSRDVFTTARPVGAAHRREYGDSLRQAEVIGSAPAGIDPPARHGAGTGNNVSRPPRTLIDRPVVVRQAPPGQNDSFRQLARPTDTLVRRAPPVVNTPRRNEQGASEPANINRRFGDEIRNDRRERPLPMERVRPDRPVTRDSAAPVQAPPPAVERQQRPERVFERQAPTPAPAAPPPMERTRPQREERAPQPPQQRIERPVPSPERMQERREARPERQERPEQRRENRPETKSEERKPKER